MRPTTPRSRPRRTTSTSGSSGTSVDGLGGVLGQLAGHLATGCCATPTAAASCSASFLLRPLPSPWASPATITTAVNSFSWSGPLSVTTYSGTPSDPAAVSSCRLVFQSRPAPSVAASSISGSNRRCTSAAARVEAAVEVDRAEQRLEGVGQDRGLVAAAGALLAAAEPDVAAEVELAAHLGQRAHVDHRGAQLGQLALGQVGVVAVERVGDDQAEHGVAEELQPLVGRQAAVLVGVGAVGQRPLQQARLDRDGEPLG